MKAARAQSFHFLPFLLRLNIFELGVDLDLVVGLESIEVLGVGKKVHLVRFCGSEQGTIFRLIARSAVGGDHSLTSKASVNFLARPLDNRDSYFGVRTSNVDALCVLIETLADLGHELRLALL